MKAGFGATFSSTWKFSRRMCSVPNGPAEMSTGLKASATCPITMALVTLPCSNHALTVSTSEAFRPGSCRSGCLTVALAELLRDRPDRIDCVSDAGAACSSDNKALWGGLKAGEAGCGGGRNTGGVLGEGSVALDGAEPAIGRAGDSPMLCNSGTAGLGTNIVLRTSRRPRSVLFRLGCAACYDHIRPRYSQNLDFTYCTQGVDHAGHCSVIVFAFFLNWGISDVELELGCGVALALRTGRLLVSINNICNQITYNPASRSASVIASRVEGGTENPSSSFSGSALGSAIGGGARDSFSSGIESWTVPLTGAAFVSISLEFAVPNPFGSSAPLEDGGCTGDGALSDSRLDERRLKGERGRSDMEGGGTSRSLFFPFPKPNADPRFEDDFCSGEEARP